MTKYVNANWHIQNVLNILNNVHPDSLAKSKGDTLYIFGDRIYADSDGVYDTIVIQKAGMPIIGGCASMYNLIDHSLWVLNYIIIK